MGIGGTVRLDRVIRVIRVLVLGAEWLSGLFGISLGLSAVLFITIVRAIVGLF